MSYETWYTIKPGEDNDISLSVPPNTFCKLSLSGKGKLKRSIKLLSDPDGHVHFTLRPSDASTEIIDFVLAYKQKSRVTHHILHLRIAKTAMQRMPFCKPIIYKVPSKAYKAALTPTQVLNMPDKELLSRGYPARPDEKKQPQAYHLWAASVSVKTHCIDAVSILDKDIMAVPEISNNWSGFKLLRPQGTLKRAGAVWRIPRVTTTSPDTAMVLSWVGLDTGALGSDLIQAGIGQDAILFSFEDITIVVTSSYVWTEFLPTQRGISRISNFRVRTGDIVYVQVWVGASSDSGDADISGPNCYFRILNITTGGYTTVRRSLGSVTFTGATAEWIVERPMIGGGFELAPLADYTSLIMGGAHAQLQSGKEVNFNASPFNNIRMVSEREGASDLSIASVSRLPPADAGLISVVSGTNPLLASVVQDKFIQFRWQGVS